MHCHRPFPGAELVYKANSSRSDYHGQLNLTKSKKWIEEKLLPNLLPNSVITIDNVPYHSASLGKGPISNSVKPDMILNCTKLFVPIILGKTTVLLMNYSVARRDVVRLPPYHHFHFNMIEGSNKKNGIRIEHRRRVYIKPFKILVRELVKFFLYDFAKAEIW